jgi:hypothetical protein
MALDPRLENLIIRSEITDVIHRYATGIDLRDWDLYSSIFDDEILIDFESFMKTPAEKMTRAAWVKRVRSLISGFDATQHVLTNHVFQIEADTAVVTLYMKAEHFLNGDSIALGGYYTHHLRRNSDRWCITLTRLTATWMRGNQDLFKMAHQRSAHADAPPKGKKS